MKRSELIAEMTDAKIHEIDIEISAKRNMIAGDSETLKLMARDGSSANQMMETLFSVCAKACELQDLETQRKTVIEQGFEYNRKMAEVIDDDAT